MSPVTTFIFRLLKKTNVLKQVTFSVPIVLNKKKIYVLLHKEIGYPNLFIEEDFLLKLIALFLPIKPGLFVDVGVNIGQTLVKLKAVNETQSYVGFEPNQTCIKYTTELIRLNNYQHCAIHPYALSDYRKSDRLAMNEKTDAAASIIANLRPNYFKDSLQIDCIPFDESGITESVSIIKIDVEGAELDVLRGMEKTIAAFHPLIICEVLDSYSIDVLAFTQQRVDELCCLLKQHNYFIFQLCQYKNRISGFKRLESITIRQWSPASYALNDYLFCHASFEAKIVQLLTQLVSV